MACSTQKSRRIALTGGPGAGKTAVLELARRLLCEHVHILPEAPGIVFRVASRAAAKLHSAARFNA